MLNTNDANVRASTLNLDGYCWYISAEALQNIQYI